MLSSGSLQVLLVSSLLVKKQFIISPLSPYDPLYPANTELHTHGFYLTTKLPDVTLVK
jgi:hypothetical protein